MTVEWGDTGMSPIKGVCTWIPGLSEFTLFLSAMNATVQVMTVVPIGHSSDYFSVTILLTEHFHKYTHLFFGINYEFLY